MSDVQIKSECLENTGQSEQLAIGESSEGKETLVKTYELIPGRVMLTTRLALPTEEIDRRNFIEQRYGLRLVPIEQVHSSRIDTEG
jgi:hypothetical protein